MKKSNILMLIMLTSIIIISVFLGIKTKISFKDDKNFNNIIWIDDMTIDINHEPDGNTKDSYTDIYYNDEINTINDLNEKSTLIAKVRLTDPNQRLNLLNTILTKVEILDVYKGNYKRGEKIYIYEPSFIPTPYKNEKTNMYASFSCYNLMLHDKDYLVFLKVPKYPSEYKLKENEKISFMFINPLLGKYSIDSNKNTSVIAEKDLPTITYGSIKDYDIVTTKKEILDKYKIFKEKIRNQYSVSPT